MRAPARLFIISFVVFIALLLFLSRFQSETITNTINRFPKIKEAYQARSAAVQSRLGAGSTSSSSSSSSSDACNEDSRSCMEPYTSKDSKNKDKDSEYKDQTSTSSEYEKDTKSKDKDRRPSTKDEDRDKDRGFTDAEQAAALERLEYKYGEEAKDKSDKNRILWMETTTTTAWDAERTEALDPEAEKARKILGEEYGDSKATATSSTDDDAEETLAEKGWRTTGFETRTKTAQKTLVSGGGGNGTSTKSAYSTPTSNASASTSAKPTSTSSTAGKSKGKGKDTSDTSDEDDEEPTATKGRWDDEAPEPTRATGSNDDSTLTKGRWGDKDLIEKGRWVNEKGASNGRWED